MGWIKGIAGSLVIALSFVAALAAGLAALGLVIWVVSLLGIGSILGNVLLVILGVLALTAIVGLIAEGAVSVKKNGFRETFKDAWRN